MFWFLTVGKGLLSYFGQPSLLRMGITAVDFSLARAHSQRPESFPLCYGACCHGYNTASVVIIGWLRPAEKTQHCTLVSVLYGQSLAPRCTLLKRSTKSPLKIGVFTRSTSSKCVDPTHKRCPPSRQSLRRHLRNRVCRVRKCTSETYAGLRK